MTLTPWAGVTDLPTTRPALAGGDDEWSALLATASEVLYVLSARRWAGVSERTLDIRAPGRRYDGQTNVELAELVIGWHESWGICEWIGQSTHDFCGRPRSLRLPDFPIVDVLSISIAGEVVDPARYRLVHRRYVEAMHGRGWPTCGDGLTVNYRHGAEPPAAGKSAAVDLAVALAEQKADPERSRLPGITTGITRQGVTITQQTASDLLAKGKTGLYGVDLWLATVNPNNRRRRSTAWSPDTDARVYPHTA